MENPIIWLERSFSIFFTADIRPKLKYYPASSAKGRLTAASPSLEYFVKQILAVTIRVGVLRSTTTELRLYWMARRRRHTLPR